MDQTFLPENESFLAENLIRSLTTPTLIPSIVYSALGAILTFAIYDKYARKGYFLPYIYFGTTALLYSFSHIFLIIFVEEERQYIESRNNGDEEDMPSITHENALYSSLIVAAVGSYFAILALLRVLEVWIRVGLQRNLHLSKYYLGVLTAMLSAIPFVLAICGNVILIRESGHEEADTERIKKALTLKLISATFNVVLIFFYLVICIAYAWSNYISNVVEKTLSESELKLISKETINLVEKKSVRTFLMLIVLGLITLIRFVHDVYITVLIIREGPVWDANTYLILVVIFGLILLIAVYLSDLANVKVLVVFSKMSSKPRKKKSTRGASRNTEEVILLSRSPIQADTEP